MRISWEQLYENIHGCCACPLGAACIQKVPGQGDPQAPPGALVLEARHETDRPADLRRHAA